MGKVYTRFRPKRRKNPTRWGGTYLYDLYKEVPPPPGEIRLILSFVLSKNRLKFAKNYFNGPNKEDMTELCFLRPTCKVDSFLNFRTPLAHNIFNHYFFMEGI